MSRSVSARQPRGQVRRLSSKDLAPPPHLLVRTIEQRVTTIKATLEAAANNTGDTKLIGETALGVEGVLNEGLNHHLFLGRVLEKVRS